MTVTTSERKLISLLKQIIKPDEKDDGIAIVSACRDHQLTDDLIEYIEEKPKTTLQEIYSWLFDEKDGQIIWYPAEVEDNGEKE